MACLFALSALFGLSDEFLGGFAAAVVPLGTAAVGWWVLVRKTRREEGEADREAREKAEDRQSKAKTREEKRVADEYRDLFNEMKGELANCRRDHRRAERRQDWLEAVLQRHGIPVPPLPPDDAEASDRHTPLPPSNPGGR